MMNKGERIIDTCENREDYWFKSWINASRKVNNLQQRIDKATEYLETATIDPQSMRHYRDCLLTILEESVDNG